MNDLTLVIPAKNESESLPKVLEELKEYDIKKIEMESLNNKEKRLETVLEKLRNLSSSPSVHSTELDQLYAEKTQLQSEKTEIERIISSLQQTKSMLHPFIKSNWIIKSMIENEFYDPFQMRMEYKID